jgi:hypothetical protein
MNGIPCQCSKPPLIFSCPNGTKRNDRNKYELVSSTNSKDGSGIIENSSSGKERFDFRESFSQFFPVSVNPTPKHNNFLVFVNHEYDREKHHYQVYSCHLFQITDVVFPIL